MSLAELEALFLAAPLGPWPARRFEGRALHRVEGPRRGLGRIAPIPFERLRFGIDFVAQTWFFVHPSLAMGRFRMRRARSRWRDTEVLALEYEGSRLPVRGVLYDELKPLGPELCLGLGGINAPLGVGDLFFFSLSASSRDRPCGGSGPR